MWWLGWFVIPAWFAIGVFLVTQAIRFDDSVAALRLVFLPVGGFGLFYSCIVLAAVLTHRVWEETHASQVAVPRGSHELGRPLWVFQWESNFIVQLFVATFQIGAALMVLILIGAVFMVLRQGNADAKKYFIAAIVFMPVVAITLYPLRQVLFPVQVWLFPEGFARVQGADVRIQRWDAIETIWGLTVAGLGVVQQHVTVEGTDGSRILLEHEDIPDDMARLVATIRKEACQHMLPKMEIALREHGQVNFGPLRLTLEGIENDGKLLPWSEVAEVRLADAKLSIIKKDRWLSWCKLSAAKVPNVWLFPTLSQRYITPVGD